MKHPEDIMNKDINQRTKKYYQNRKKEKLTNNESIPVPCL